MLCFLTNAVLLNKAVSLTNARGQESKLILTQLTSAVSNVIVK